MTAGRQESNYTEDGFVSAKKVIIFVIFSAVVFAMVGLYGRIDEVLAALLAIDWYWVLPTMMGLSFLNYVIRYVKWQYYLQRIDVDLSHTDSFIVFLSGFTLTTTPGKIGEAVKGYFIRDIDGTPVAKTVPVVISERVTDLLALVILAVVGFALGVNTGDQLLSVLLLGGVVLAGALVLGTSTFYQMFLTRLTSMGPLKRFQDSCDLIEDTMTRTLGPKPLLLMAGLSVPGWFMECIELWLLLTVLAGPSLAVSPVVVLLIATFIHATASVIGALTFSPGGVGTYELTSVVLVILLLSLSETLASAATILIRVVTLWFSVIVGFAALAMLTRRTNRRKETSE
ncbi:flippase-like domain-containing protein [Candidatus Thorarchaeota archaeon]|nr:MAG: flippase-like domain-containing protein [Candidatus Thorarchaeota archaeon]